MNFSKQPDTESRIIDTLKTIYDPEIPINIYDLGLIYGIKIDDQNKVLITMTLTAPNCPIADYLLDEIRYKVGKIEGITGVDINLTFNPPWDPRNLSDEAKLELGFL